MGLSTIEPLAFLVFLPGLTLLLTAFMIKYLAPKEPNHWFGYRTGSSMKSKETWEEAHRFSPVQCMRAGIFVLLVSSGALLLPELWMMILAPTMLLLPAFAWVTITTENHLKKTFASKGNLITKELPKNEIKDIGYKQTVLKTVLAVSLVLLTIPLVAAGVLHYQLPEMIHHQFDLFGNPSSSTVSRDVGLIVKALMWFLCVATVFLVYFLARKALKKPGISKDHYYMPIVIMLSFGFVMSGIGSNVLYFNLKGAFFISPLVILLAFLAFTTIPSILIYRRTK